MEKDISSNNPISVLVNKVPGSASIFEDLGLDFYCDGNKSLAETCAEAGYDPESILEGIYNAAPEKVPRCERDLSMAGMDRLLEHTAEAHYGFVHEAVPPLTRLIKKVVAKYGKSHPELVELENLFALLWAKFGCHMLKEEKTLYSLARNIKSGSDPWNSRGGLTANQIPVLKFEHLKTKNLLNEIRYLTKGYAIPPYACPTYRAMLNKLKKLEFDLHRHIHEENNIIYPRAL